MLNLLRALSNESLSSVLPVHVLVATPSLLHQLNRLVIQVPWNIEPWEESSDQFPHMSHWGQWRSGSIRWHHWGPWSSRALLEQCNQTSSSSSRPYRCASASLGKVCRGQRQQSEGPMLSPTSLSSDCLCLLLTLVLVLSEVIHSNIGWRSWYEENLWILVSNAKANG